jgi:lipopolysaccharide biosynthesis protein
VHVYYIELLDEIATALRDSGLRLRLIVTTTIEKESAVRQRLAELGLDAELETHENRGRDILPFLRVTNRLLDEGVELVLKLHTKSSGHRLDGPRWRAELIGRLLNRTRAATIVDAFVRNPHLGCVAPEGHYLPLSVYWGWNEETVRYLCRRMGVPAPELTRDFFAAGSMFWIRTAALRPLLDAHLGEWEFPPEGGHFDGTMAHGVERALGLAVGGAGYLTRTAAAVCGISFSDDAGYAYAEAADPDLR